MLEVNNLTLQINNKILLDNISFNITSGILCVLGLNGVGKTTLLKTLCGLNKKYTGNISYNNKSVSSFSRKELAKIISFVPQEHTPYFSFTVKEMLLLGRTPHLNSFNFPTKNDYAIVDRVISELKIESIVKRKFFELSGGEKRLVLIGLCLVQETQIICFDEPTTFLDLKNSMLIIQMIKKLAVQFKKQIIITIHDINQAITLADYVLILYSQNDYEFGNTKSIITASSLSRLYNLDFSILEVGAQLYYIPSSKNDSF